MDDRLRRRTREMSAQRAMEEKEAVGARLGRSSIGSRRRRRPHETKSQQTYGSLRSALPVRRL